MTEDSRLGREVFEANIALHTHLAEKYTECEPHFRPENVAKVRSRLKRIFEELGAEKLLDLGCGTGFIIDIAKEFAKSIDGVDATRAMLDRVDVSGPATIRLHEADTAAFAEGRGTYDIVTAYSFLHHLFDVRSTLVTAFESLRPGGVFYADLDPNHDFWAALEELDPDGSYDPIVAREIAMTVHKDEDMKKTFGVSKKVFNYAEYGKNIKGGFTGAELEKLLLEVGFSRVEVHYHWFLGEAAIINDERQSKEQGLRDAKVMSDMLQRIQPLSRSLFKYLGFVATK